MRPDWIIPPREHWLLKGIPLEQLESVLAAGYEARYLPGDVLFREGDATDGLHLVTAGNVRVTAVGEGGETFLAVVRADEVLGEMGVLDGAPRSGTATAMTVACAYFLPAEAFLDLLERSTTVCMRLLAILTARLRIANGRLGELPATSSLGPSPESLGL